MAHIVRPSIVFLNILKHKSPPESSHFNIDHFLGYLRLPVLELPGILCQRSWNGFPFWPLIVLFLLRILRVFGLKPKWLQLILTHIFILCPQSATSSLMLDVFCLLRLPVADSFFPASCSFDGSLTNCLSLAAAFYFQFLLYIPSNSSVLCLPFNFYTPQNFALLCRNVLLSS